LWSKKVSRRRLIAGSALTGSALAATVVVGCSSGDDSSTSAQAGTKSFTLETFFDSDGFAFIGSGGAIDGQRNPTLRVDPNDSVDITLVNGDGAEHDISIPAFGQTAPRSAQTGAMTTISFTVSDEGTFDYFCTVPGHRAAGMEGVLQVGSGAVVQQPATGADIVRDPTDLPGPIGDRGPELVKIVTEAVELQGQLAQGTAYEYWTFDGRVPGPFWRARVGDTVELTLRNSADSKNTHSIDLHAVSGPGGGAAVTQVTPGDEKTFTFKALKPGLYIYHCATPSVAHHISAGMYGLILIEPEGGLPTVDHEFYVGQHEIYTEQDFGTKGLLTHDHAKMSHELPEYVLMNGAVGALTEQHPMQVGVGESVRIYYGVGGPNLTSSFHVIGDIWDRVWNQASLTNDPLLDVQTTTVAPGGATVVDFVPDVPGTYLLVDHALSRLERGAVGYVIAEGAENPEIFHEGSA
jgi:nitrite reductase (NO-forming)